jgi:peptide/nickel transport system substrate-binding protein
VPGCDLPILQGPPKPVDGGTLTMALPSDPTTLNRFLAADAVSQRAVAPLFPNLYEARPDMSVAPDLAESMPTLSDDKKTWTVKLRAGAKWTDGRPIGADDVVSTVGIQRALAARNPVEAIFDWEKLDRVEKVDDLTVRFVLTEVYAPFLANSLVTFVAPAHVYGAIPPTSMADDPVSDQPTVTGGPFKFDKRDAGRQIDLVANPDYYGGRPHIDRLVEKVITDPTNAANELGQGGVQWLPDMSPDAMAKLKPNSNVALHSYPALGYYDVRFNDRPDHVFGDRLVRQAFASAVDKEAIVKDATQGQGVTLWGDILPTSWAYDDTAVVKYKVDRPHALELMKQAGWATGADGVATRGDKRFSVKFYVRNDTPARQRAVEMIAQQVREIGMELVPTPVDYNAFYEAVKPGNYDIALAGWAVEADPDQFRVLHSSQLKPEKNPDGRNWTGYSSPDLDALLEQERATLKDNDDDTRRARREVLGKIEHLLGEEVVTYYLWIDAAAQGFSSSVGGVEAGPGGTLINLDNSRNVRVYRDWYMKSVK